MPNVERQAGQSVGVPVMPRVNLMPPEIAEAARFRRFQLAMGGAVVAAVGIVAALYMSAHGGVATAQKQVDDAAAQHASLQSQLTSLQSVQDVYTQVAARQAMLTLAMGQEIRWSSYLTDLSLRIPDNVWLTAVSATESGVGASGAASATAATSATPTGIGTVTFSGVAYTHDDVATWLESLSRERGYTNPYFSNSSESKIGPKGVVTFSSSVVLDDKAKSGRYTKPAGS